MKNADRGKAKPSPTQVHHYNQAKQMEELDSRRKQVDDLWNQLETADAELDKQKQAAEQASQAAKQATALASKRKRENENLLQRLMGAITSRNSMRGRLGNMTMQRNRAIQQVEKLTTQNRVVMQELKATTDKLGEAYQQVNVLQTEYEQDMTELARAYQDMEAEQRANLPEFLRSLLDQIEEDYTGVGL